MKTSSCIFLIPAALIFPLSAIFSQSFHEIKSVEIAEPTCVSIDKAGYIFLATYQGDIVSYNPAMDEKMIFSPSNPNTTNVLDARQGLRIFTFNRDLQIFRLINRNLSLNEDYSFPPEKIGYVELATSSYDNNVWLIDQSEFSLKKFEIISNTIASATSLNLLLDADNHELLYCEEYQNRLFLSTKNSGILIFDNFGSYIKTYNKNNISFFNFWEDEIYFIEANTLVKLNLYSEEQSVTELPKNANWLFPLIFNKRIYLFSKEKLVLFEYR